MIYNTDILIWIQRGNEKAAALIEKDDDKYLSIQSHMELLQGAKNKIQHTNKTDEKDTYYSRPSAAGMRMSSLHGRIYGVS